MAEAILLEALKFTLKVSLTNFQKDLVLQSGKAVQDAEAKLRQWLCVLKDLDGRKSKDASIDNLKKDIRDLVCRLQDFLQIYSNKVQSGRGGSIKNSFRKVIALLDIKSFRMVHLKVEEINTRIMSTIQVLKDLNILVVNKTEEERSDSANENLEPENQQNFRYRNTPVEEEHITGMDDELEALNSFLVDDSHRVICIYGMGGIGKTTIARKLFTDPVVEDHYDISVWITIAQNFTLENVLVDMVEQISRPERGINHSDLDIEEFAETVYKSLKGRRYLVVFDDVWQLEGLYSLLRILPNDRNGSKLMFTTRLREVATYVAGDDRDGLIYSMRFLNVTESSKLFWKTASLGDPQGKFLFPNSNSNLSSVILTIFRKYFVALTVGPGLSALSSIRSFS